MDKKEEFSDEELLIRCLDEGDSSCFNILVKRHQSHVAGITASYRLLDMVGDLTQETFIEAWKKLPTLRDRSKFRNWLSRIAHNTAKTAAKKRRRENIFLQAESDEENISVIDTVQDTKPNPLEELIQKEEGNKISQLFKQFIASRSKSHEQRVEILKLFLKAHSYEEIAVALKISEVAVRVGMMKIKRDLKEFFLKKFDNHNEVNFK